MSLLVRLSYQPANRNAVQKHQKTFCIFQGMMFISFLSLGTGCGESGKRDLDILPVRVAARGQKVPQQLQFRDRPLQVFPVINLGKCVDDQQFQVALEASLPRWLPPSVPSLIHELHVWGPHCEFSEEQFGERWTGRKMIETLLNDKYCKERTVRLEGMEDRAYLVECPYGIHPTQAGTYDAVEYRAESHFGVLSKLMAEANQPLSIEVVASSGCTGSLEDVLHDTVMRFSWGAELEFVACALAYWLPPNRSWRNQFHETFTFDELTLRLINKPLGEGACGGTHVPYAVVVMLRVNEQLPILSDEVRAKAEAWLRTLINVLEANQKSDGSWGLDWAVTGREPVIFGAVQLDRITIAGHHLEWIALLPEDFYVNRHMVRGAVQSVATTIEQLPSRGSFKTTLPCSHAARAMALLERRDAFEFWRESNDPGVKFESE